jgi:hypothetical protein
MLDNGFVRWQMRLSGKLPFAAMVVGSLTTITTNRQALILVCVLHHTTEYLRIRHLLPSTCRAMDHPLAQQRRTSAGMRKLGSQPIARDGLQVMLCSSFHYPVSTHATQHKRTIPLKRYGLAAQHFERITAIIAPPLREFRLLCLSRIISQMPRIRKPMWLLRKQIAHCRLPLYSRMLKYVGTEKRREKVVLLRELQRAIIYNE